MYHFSVFILVFLIAFLTNLGITPILIKLSDKYHWYDSVDNRKIHPGKISRIGGVGIFSAFAFSLFLFVIGCHIFDIELNDISKYKHLSIVVGFFIITIMGLADDFFDLKASVKFVIQGAAALCISLGGTKFDIFSIPGTEINFVLHPFLAHALTILWVISFCNAINLMDGMDGLAGGISFIAASFYIIIFSLLGNFTAVGISTALLGAVLAFLVFNFPPAKIFMGDSGSLFLGFCLSVIPLINNQPPVSSNVLLPSLLIFIIPIIDMVAAILRRKRKNLPVFSADREHLHHKLLDFGFLQQKILLIIYSFSILAGITAVIFILLDKSISMLFFFFVWAVFISLFIWLHYKNQKRKTEIKNEK